MSKDDSVGQFVAYCTKEAGFRLSLHIVRQSLKCRCKGIGG